VTGNDSSKRGVVDVAALSIEQSDGGARELRCQVVEENALTLDVEGVGQYTLMWTPTGPRSKAYGFTVDDGVLGSEAPPEDLALALGFALTEGLILSLSDIKALSVCADNPDLVQIQLRDPAALTVRRKNVVVNSSCGICGPGEILEENALNLSSVEDQLRIDVSEFPSLMEQMRSRQAVFEQTGGSHAAGIFNAQGELLALAEDLGRHNALDKAIGQVLLQRGSLQGCGAVLSSRLSLEMVVKAIRSGLEIVLAVSAPTSLAIDVAKKFGVTLCGFVRGSSANVYAHPHRLGIPQNKL
jgi:FdhD protein